MMVRCAVEPHAKLALDNCLAENARDWELKPPLK